MLLWPYGWQVSLRALCSISYSTKETARNGYGTPLNIVLAGFCDVNKWVTCEWPTRCVWFYYNILVENFALVLIFKVVWKDVPWNRILYYLCWFMVSVNILIFFFLKIGGLLKPQQEWEQIIWPYLKLK